MNRGVVEFVRLGSDRLDYPAMCRDVFILGADSQRQSVQACRPSGVAHDGPLGEPQFDTARRVVRGVDLRPVASRCSAIDRGSPGLIARQQHDIRT